MSKKQNVLLLCVANSARSQIAEAWLRYLYGARFITQSAGSQPASALHPMALQVMQEVGVNMTGQKPKKLADLPQGFLDKLDWLITLCAEEKCPVLPGDFQRLTIALPDPATVQGSTETQLKAFREVRDAIKRYLTSWQS